MTFSRTLTQDGQLRWVRRLPLRGLALLLLLFIVVRG